MHTINFCFVGTYYTDTSEAPDKQALHSQSLPRESTDSIHARRGSESTLVPPLLSVTFALAMVDDVTSSGNSISDRKSQSGILNLPIDHSDGQWELSDLWTEQNPKL